MTNLPAVPSDQNSLALAPEFLNQLETREDYENAFTMVAERKNQMIWWEADLILNYYKKFHQQHLDVYRAGQLLDDSTVKYYLRTASAFPAEARIPTITFSHHYQASYADEWDSKTLTFKTEKRFFYAEQAADNGLSTRRLRTIMDQDKKKTEQNVTIIPCDHCLGTEGEINHYMIYISKRGNTPITADLHPTCFDRVRDFIYHGGQKNS